MQVREFLFRYGAKIPWGTWFAKDKPVCKAKEPPMNMLVAMGLTSFLCVLLGVYPKLLYHLLPYPVQYEPYTPAHVVSVSQLLGFTLVAFWLFRGKLYGEPTLTLDTDWFYRIAGKWVTWFCEKPLMAFAQFVDGKVMSAVDFFVWCSRNPANALHIKKEEAKLKVKRLMISPERAHKHRQIIEEKRSRYPGELPKLTLGASLVLILLAFSLYLILHLLMK